MGRRWAAADLKRNGCTAQPQLGVRRLSPPHFTGGLPLGKQGGGSLKVFGVAFTVAQSMRQLRKKAAKLESSGPDRGGEGSMWKLSDTQRARKTKKTAIRSYSLRS